MCAPLGGLLRSSLLMGFLSPFESVRVEVWCLNRSEGASHLLLPPSRPRSRLGEWARPGADFDARAAVKTGMRLRDFHRFGEITSLQKGGYWPTIRSRPARPERPWRRDQCSGARRPVSADPASGPRCFTAQPTRALPRRAASGPSRRAARDLAETERRPVAWVSSLSRRGRGGGASGPARPPPPGAARAPAGPPRPGPARPNSPTPLATERRLDSPLFCI